ncbi:MAG: hypothetical protein KAY24_03600 [Candidatus Eisenbacteria sp.]|nr:hypothetical protein [Candidatus Eisenbacteria bacterium]
MRMAFRTVWYGLLVACLACAWSAPSAAAHVAHADSLDGGAQEAEGAEAQGVSASSEEVLDGAGSEAEGGETPSTGWFDTEHTPTAVATLLFGAILLFFIRSARSGKPLFIRRIAGLEAVDEAVGRATEMGRPILYSPGLDPMEEVATVASINILGQVARKAGEYETRLIMPNRDPIVMTVAQEVVREALTQVGRPDLYNADDIYYTTQSQFGYAAAVCGTMMRERPATNFFIGHFYAESLILAETGNATGAIQIAGTDSDSQLPFFICACDYTLIGEELYAGSVYLSREPLLLGALKGQDVAKAVLLVVLIAGAILAFFGIDIGPYLG